MEILRRKNQLDFFLSIANLTTLVKGVHSSLTGFVIPSHRACNLFLVSTHAKLPYVSQLATISNHFHHISSFSAQKSTNIYRGSRTQVGSR